MFAKYKKGAKGSLMVMFRVPAMLLLPVFRHIV
jgi:hypothetical protein